MNQSGVRHACKDAPAPRTGYVLFLRQKHGSADQWNQLSNKQRAKFNQDAKAMREAAPMHTDIPAKPSKSTKSTAVIRPLVHWASATAALQAQFLEPTGPSGAKRTYVCKHSWHPGCCAGRRHLRQGTLRAVARDVHG